jgi:hypothetical protein
VGAVHTQQQGAFPASSVIWTSFISSVLGYRLVNSASSPNHGGEFPNGKEFLIQLTNYQFLKKRTCFIELVLLGEDEQHHR